MFTRSEVESCLKDYYLSETVVKLLDMKLWHVHAIENDYRSPMAGIYTESFENATYIILNVAHLSYAPMILEYFINLFCKDGKKVIFHVNK